MTDSNAAPARRPPSWLLILLAVAVGALIVYEMWPSAAKPATSSNPPRAQRKQAAGTSGSVATPESLDVRLDQLQQTPPSPEEAGRNPFRFYVKPPPPPPPPSIVRPPPGAPGGGPPPPPPQPAGPPPIPLKFFGTVEKEGRKVAAFVTNDGRGLPIYAGEGEVVLGQYRVVKIGVESVTMEYLDGRGRQTIPLRGDYK
jgi:hypothetical protein